MLDSLLWAPPRYRWTSDFPSHPTGSTPNPFSPKPKHSHHLHPSTHPIGLSTTVGVQPASPIPAAAPPLRISWYPRDKNTQGPEGTPLSWHEDSIIPSGFLLMLVSSFAQHKQGSIKWGKTKTQCAKTVSF